MQKVSLSRQGKQALRSFVQEDLDDLEQRITERKREIANLRIAGNHRMAERKERDVRFLWELHSELTAKIDNIEVSPESAHASAPFTHPLMEDAKHVSPEKCVLQENNKET